MDGVLLFDFPPEWDALIAEVVAKFGPYPPYFRFPDPFDAPLIVEEE